MADNLVSQPPLMIPVADANGTLSKAWAIWFRDLYRRVAYKGGNAIDDNLDLIDGTIDTLDETIAQVLLNVIAIAAGIIDGTGAGDNAKAALLTRGLAEISRLGLTMGASRETFAGLTGLGDLVTTCISPKGRNRSFGERIGKGQTTEQALGANESVVEGVATCKSVVALAGKYDVEMPITRAIYEVLFENKPVQKAIADLMERELKAE